MSRIVKEYVVLQRWFPANDPVATNVARLCILKEDLELEYRGWLGQKISELDINQIPWRKLYFLRNIFKTMMEIHSAVHTLNMNTDFKEALRQQPQPLQNAFEELNRITDTAHPLMKVYRNSIGGHVKEQSVAIALTRLSSFFRNILILLSSIKIGIFRIILINQSVTLIAIKKLEHRV